MNGMGHRDTLGSCGSRSPPVYSLDSLHLELHKQFEFLYELWEVCILYA